MKIQKFWTSEVTDLPLFRDPVIPMRFNGSDYNPTHDNERLTGQILRVYELMSDGTWRTLGEIEAITGDPQASLSAQLRHLRKERFGGHTIEKRPRGDRERGLFEYKLIPSSKTLHKST